MSEHPHPADGHGFIRVQGARENNLKDISLELPKRRLTVFTGVSGSGKSSLVFGTIAAESQRLINETYSAFLQGFMPSLSRPEVDVLEGLTTAIIVDQERMGANARSTVGTATDANAMLRVLFSRLGQPRIGPPTAYSFNVPTRKASGAMTVEKGKGERIVVREAIYHGGMCPRCEGMGSINAIDLNQLYDPSRSLAQGALTIPGYKADGWSVRIFTESGFLDPDKPIRDYSNQELHDFLYREPVKVKVNGINLTYEGLVPQIQKSFLSKDVDALQPHIRAFVERAVTFTACPDCGGTRLNEAARSSRIAGVSIADACAMQINDLAEWVRGLGEPSVAPLLGKLRETLDSFVEIGLGYLSLDRPSGTLSGGEAQRTRMIRHLGSSLTDVTYVFDEPTIGLHPHDIQRMNELLLRLGDKGNTVLVVEHKPEVIAIADHVVDLGPGAGAAGGEVVFQGTLGGLRRSGTLTGRHLGDRAALKAQVRRPSGSMAVRGVSTHNLRDVDVDIPLGVLVVVTGVAGSGKSSLIHGSVSGREGVVTVDQSAIRGSRRSNPATYTDLLEPHPQGVREGERGQARAVQRQLRRRVPHLQRRRGDLHGPGDDGGGEHRVRGLRGAAVPGLRARVSARRAEHRRGARPLGGRGGGVLRRGGGAYSRGARHPAAHSGGRPRLPPARPAAHHPLRRRAAAAQAGHAHGRRGRRLRAGRAH
jgi:excinuclease UvrABC ATPase subunit